MPLSNARYAAVMREYDRRRADAEARADARREELYRTYPALAAAERDLQSLAVAQAEARIRGKAFDAAKDAEARQAILTRKAAVLAQAGLTEADLLPAWRCPDCKDTGYIGNARCHCFASVAAALHPAQPDLEDVFSRENFDAFNLNIYDDAEVLTPPGTTVRAYMRGILEVLLHYASDFTPQAESLLFSGPTGVGKTFLMHCIAAALSEAGFSVLYYTADELSRLFSRQIRERDNEELLALDESIVSCDLLVIDDLGTEFGNSLDATKLFFCINERYLRGKPVLLSTNISMDAAADRYTERVTSRIATYKRIPLYGKDLRRSARRG